MLSRRSSARSVVFHASTLLEAIGVPHAFSTRLGGLSPAPFDSLNLGNPNGCDVQDDYERIWANYRLLQEAADCSNQELCRVHQVHGASVAVVSPREPFDCSQKADAIVGNDAARVLSVRIADCVPLLLADRTGTAVAAVHAGWRGIVAEVAMAALQTLRERFDVPPGSVIAAIGPCIGPDAFEVGAEVAEAFGRRFKLEQVARPADGGKWLVDLRQALRLQLLQAGVPAGQIDTSDRCTFRDIEEFFSHRRDRGLTGRMAAIIAPRASRLGRES